MVSPTEQGQPDADDAADDVNSGVLAAVIIVVIIVCGIIAVGAFLVVRHRRGKRHIGEIMNTDSIKI